jgi:hypothetical protein
MSYYPNEGNPLWERYSTQAIIHTLNVYSRYSFAYPYPIAISVNGPVGGMEYPMICLTVRARTRRHLLGAHEVRLNLGHHPRSRAQLLPDDRQQSTSGNGRGWTRG